MTMLRHDTEYINIYHPLKLDRWSMMIQYMMYIIILYTIIGIWITNVCGCTLQHHRLTDLRKNQQSISLDPAYLRWWQQMAFLPGSRWTAQPHLWRQTKAIFSLWTLTSLWVQEIKKLNKYFKNPSPSPLALTSRCPKYISTFLSFLCITITTCSSAPLLPITVGCYVCAPQSLNLICSLHKLI